MQALCKSEHSLLMSVPKPAVLATQQGGRKQQTAGCCCVEAAVPSSYQPVVSVACAAVLEPQPRSRTVVVSYRQIGVRRASGRACAALWVPVVGGC